MTRTQAVKGALAALPSGSDAIEVTLEALRRMGIDPSVAFKDGQTVEDHVRGQTYLFGLWGNRAPIEHLKFAVTTARESYGGKALYHG